MAMPIMGKRVSGLLDEELIRARDWHSICSTGSGSEHEGEDASSSSLSGLVCEFFEPDEPNTAIDDRRREDVERDDDGGIDNVAEVLQNVLDPFRKSDKRLRLRLYSDVMKTSEALRWLRSSGSGYRRAVMARLREHGYNAGICKAKWEGSGALTAGNYEYVDIVVNNKERYIVDLGFSAEFEIARPTEEYEKLTAVMPKVMVGRADEVKQVVRIMSEAARRSMKRRGLIVPPWRKSRYMVVKWLGPYRRTVNPLPTSSWASQAAGKREVKCRTVGFNAAPPPRAGAIVL